MQKKIFMLWSIATLITADSAFLVGLPKYLIEKLQTVQNTAARMLCRVGKYDHGIIGCQFRIKYKI